MSALLRVAALALLASAAASSAAARSGVTPVEKVITLLEDLKTQVETEGKDEAKTYNDFACFCSDTTKGKSGSITTGRDNIETLSADIQEKTASREEKITELKQRQVDQEGFKKDLEETTLRCAKEAADYEGAAADLSKAISSLEAAIQAMQETKPAASLLSIRQSVERSLALADALNLMAEPKRKAVSGLLQAGSRVDPSDPEFKYHSQGIIDTLQKLLTDFRAAKSDLDAEWAKTKATCDSTKLSLNNKITENEAAMGTLSSDIDTLKGGIATAREDLVNAESVLTDDQLYLKDLTERCETRAKDWDQRSQLRADELEALSGALAIMKESVSSLDVDANKRALFLERSTSSVGQARNATLPGTGGKAASFVSISKHAGSLSFLQGAAVKGHARGLRGAHAAALSSRARQDQVAALLSQEGRRLGSTALSSLAMHVAADPFTKVKQLIQRLVERLLKESTEEATKKGWCDTQLGKAETDRDYRLADAKNLDAELKMLEIKQDELEEEISILGEAIAKLEEDLATATTIRKAESEENLEVIRKAMEGVTALRQAISILKVFYARAGRAKVLLQASPVDEDTTGAGFEGAYQGKQEASTGIIGMLHVIKSDFERTVKMTDAAEDQAHASFTEFDRVSKADISGKQTKKALDEEDLKTTKNNIAQGMADLQTAQELLDSALKTIEDLKPTCIDTGMSYEERGAKREEEITALKKALCILDTEGVEADCQA